MQRFWTLTAVTALVAMVLVGITPPPQAQAVPPRQAATATATATATRTATATSTTTTTPTVTTTPTITTTPTVTTTPQPIPFPTVVTLANGYRITFIGYVVNGDGTVTYTYRVDELPSAQDLSNWVIGLPGCVVVDAAPEPNEIVNPDPNAGLYGVKWQTGAGFTSGLFTVTLLGTPEIGLIEVAAKGPDVVIGEVAGPLCSGGDPTPPPPAVIIIEPPPPPVIIIQNNVIIINIIIVINSTGGPARNCFLVLDLELLELLDLQFLEGLGYVKEIKDGKVYIGIGQNNRFSKGKFRLDLKFRVTADVTVEQTVRLRYGLNYDDSDGATATDPQEIAVTVPPIVSEPPVIDLPRLSEDAIDDRFRARWASGGGLRIYGLPLTRAVTLRSGISVQYFERARFEYHPANAGTPYVILLGRLAVELGYSQPPVPAPTAGPDRDWYFPATGHLVAPAFRTYWQSQGGLQAFGYPIGEAFVDARGLTVQYFERARLELHPEFAGTENEVLLGLLGEESLRARGGNAAD